MNMADIAQDQQDRLLERAIAAARGEIEPGVAGECIECGEESMRLIGGACARCRDTRDRLYAGNQHVA